MTPMQTEPKGIASRYDANSEAGDTRALSLAELLLLAGQAIPAPSASQARLLQQLVKLRTRLTNERLQLAVLGQFKRGKSSLLNALLATDILPTGVIPVTAIPTFLHAGHGPVLRATYLDGRVENFEGAESETVRDRLTALVTEERNPGNRLGIARVDIMLPSEFLACGVVLIDTPGVGSTFRHNTAAADAVLPECDATLFVVSPDPPITEVELEYLARIRQTVARLIIVLNKVDTLEADERETAVAFLRRVLSEHGMLGSEAPIFCVSARRSLRAAQGSKPDDARLNGFAELQAHLLQFLANEKRATLHAAIRRKAAALVAELQLEAEIASKALHLPLEDLERRLAAFDRAAENFEVERRTAADLLAGDQRRVLQELETSAETLRAEARLLVYRKLDDALAAQDDDEAVREAVTGAVLDYFESALQGVVRDVGERLASIFRVHQQRADELIQLVRRTAADLLEIPFRAPESDAVFEPKRDPFWITAAGTVELSPIPVTAFDRLLPAPLRRKRVRRRMFAESDSVLVRNVENLRWATLQNIKDAFRRFGAELDDRLAMSLEATRGAMKAALDRRRGHSEAVEPEIKQLHAACAKLADIQHALTRLQ